MPGAQHDAHTGSQRLRPLLQRAESRCRPVERTHPCAHLAASSEYRLDQLRFGEIHDGIPRLGISTVRSAQPNYYLFSLVRGAIVVGEAAYERCAPSSLHKAATLQLLKPTAFK